MGMNTSTAQVVWMLSVELDDMGVTGVVEDEHQGEGRGRHRCLKLGLLMPHRIESDAKGSEAGVCAAVAGWEAPRGGNWKEQFARTRRKEQT